MDEKAINVTEVEHVVIRPFTPEYATLFARYLKHITTLSTSSIVLQIAFLEKVFPHPRWKALIMVSLLSFTLSIMGASISYATVLSLSSANPHPYNMALKVANVGLKSMHAAWVGFVVGMIAVLAFALKNLFVN